MTKLSLTVQSRVSHCLGGREPYRMLFTCVCVHLSSLPEYPTVLQGLFASLRVLLAISGESRVEI